MGAKLAGVLMAAFAGVALPHTSWGEVPPQVRVTLLNDSVVPVNHRGRHLRHGIPQVLTATDIGERTNSKIA